MLTAGPGPETNPPEFLASLLTIRHPSAFSFLMPWGRSLKRSEKHDLLFLLLIFSPHFHYGKVLTCVTSFFTYCKKPMENVSKKDVNQQCQAPPLITAHKP